jgi:hypothetical protein
VKERWKRMMGNCIYVLRFGYQLSTCLSLTAGRRGTLRDVGGQGLHDTKSTVVAYGGGYVV